MRNFNFFLFRLIKHLLNKFLSNNFYSFQSEERILLNELEKKKCNNDKIKEILTAGADPNVCNKEGIPALAIGFYCKFLKFSVYFLLFIFVFNNYIFRFKQS